MSASSEGGGASGNLGPGRWTTSWRLARAWARQHRTQSDFALRVTVAAMLSFAVAQYLQLRLPLWAVLTALIATQISVGKSFKATVDYLMGTLGGAIFGAGLSVLIPHNNEWVLLALLGIAVLPLAFLASINPRWSAAPVTAVIVLLVPLVTHASPIASALDRILEVGVGAVTGFLVSYFLLPSRAYEQALELAASTQDRLARAFRALMAGSASGLSTQTLHQIQDGLGEALHQLKTISEEAEHERAVGYRSEPDLRPLTRTMLRLRHDLVMLGRAVEVPLPQAIREALLSPLSKVEADAARYLGDQANALRLRQTPPPMTVVEQSFNDFLAAIGTLRANGATRALTSDEAERFFALGFALEQIRRNLRDLDRCVRECAETPKNAPEP